MDPECPGPDCLMCNGEACNLCGAGCWNNDPDRRCEHDVTDRHREPDPVHQLSSLLRDAGARVTFDPERSIAKPCIVCGTKDRPRDLVQIGTFTISIGGNIPGDPITRPMCASCEALVR